MNETKQYDNVYNERLCIVFVEKNYVRDSAKEKQEDCLEDMLISLYEKTEKIELID